MFLSQEHGNLVLILRLNNDPAAASAVGKTWQHYFVRPVICCMKYRFSMCLIYYMTDNEFKNCYQSSDNNLVCFSIWSLKISETTSLLLKKKNMFEITRLSAWSITVSESPTGTGLKFVLVS